MTSRSQRYSVPKMPLTVYPPFAQTTWGGAPPAVGRRVGRPGVSFSDAAMAALTAYPWPGNVRELANVLERAQILAEDHVITPDDLPEALVEASPPAGDSKDPNYLREVERCHIAEVLRREKGNKVHAAKALGISRRALYRLIAKYHLEGARTEAGEGGD